MIENPPPFQSMKPKNFSSSLHGVMWVIGRQTFISAEHRQRRCLAFRPTDCISVCRGFKSLLRYHRSPPKTAYWAEVEAPQRVGLCSHALQCRAQPAVVRDARRHVRLVNGTSKLTNPYPRAIHSPGPRTGYRLARGTWPSQSDAKQ